MRRVSWCVVVALALSSFGACKPSDRKSHVGESCTKTADCAGDARCLRQVCVAPEAESARAFATLEDLARALVRVVQANDRRQLRELLIRDDEVKAAAQAAGAGPEALEALVRRVRDATARFDHRWVRLQRDAQRRGVRLEDIRFARLVPPRTKQVGGLEVIDGDLDIRLTVDGREGLRLDVEECVRVQAGWMLADPEVELEEVR